MFWGRSHHPKDTGRRTALGDVNADLYGSPYRSMDVEDRTRYEAVLAMHKNLRSRIDRDEQRQMILDAYDQVVSEWTLIAEDADAGYARYFRDGPVATGLELAAVQDRARGRVLL